MTWVLVGLCNSNIRLLGYECVSESHVLSNLFGYLGWLTSIRVKADRNVEFFRIERSKFEKRSKTSACVLDTVKTATLMASACSNSPGA